MTVFLVILICVFALFAVYELSLFVKALIQKRKAKKASKVKDDSIIEGEIEDGFQE